MLQKKLEQIGEEIKTANTIAVFTHGSPDGDAVGSATATKNLINSKYPDKKVDVFILDSLPSGFKCLKDTESVEFLDKKSNFESIKARNYDLAISVDCAEKKLMRNGAQLFDSAKRKVKIDHHPERENFADINLSCPDASSASQVVLLLAESMKVPLNKDLASDIYMAMVTDTQGFRYMPKPAGVFEDASKLTKTGFDERKVYCSSIDHMSKEAFRFYTDVIKNVKFSEDGKVAYVVDDSLRHKSESTGKEVNLSRTLNKQGLEKPEIKHVFDQVVGVIMPNIEGVKIAAKINEQEDWIKGSVETGASLRGNGVGVRELAEKFGGGGHEFAAAFIGAKQKASDFVQKISEYLKQKEQQN